MKENKTVQKFLSSHFPTYARRNHQPLRVIKSVEDQITCRTKAFGLSHYHCPNNDSSIDIYHSCRNRSCTVCGFKKQQSWLEKQKECLLNCEHFHIVFTLPAEYRRLWLYNREWFIQAQFEVSSECLKTLLFPGNKKGKSYLDATPGIISVLHTWGRQLNLHPHIHCLVSAGGLTEQQQWKSVENDYLMPVKVLKSLYRGLFQARIKALLYSENVKIPPGQHRAALLKEHRKLYQQEWSVRIQNKYSHGNGVLAYLSRYLGCRPIKPGQITSMDHCQVTFNYKDHRDGKHKSLRLTNEEFMRRLLMHQGEKGIHHIRYYGLYAAQAKKKWLKCVSLLGVSEQSRKEKGSLKDSLKEANRIFCECCGAVMQPVYVRYKQRHTENSIIERVYSNTLPPHVQQGVEPDRLNAGFT